MCDSDNGHIGENTHTTNFYIYIYCDQIHKLFLQFAAPTIIIFYLIKNISIIEIINTVTLYLSTTISLLLSTINIIIISMLFY